MQAQLRSLEDQWLKKVAEDLQGYAETNDMQRFYKCTKRIYGPPTRTTMPVRSADGQIHLQNQAKYYLDGQQQQPSVHNSTDSSALNNLPLLPMLQELDRCSSPEEVSNAIESLKLRKSQSSDSVPSELLKSGEQEMHSFLR